MTNRGKPAGLRGWRLGDPRRAVESETGDAPAAPSRLNPRRPARPGTQKIARDPRPPSDASPPDPPPPPAKKPIKQVSVEIPYAPRIHFVPFHMRKQRWALMVCHRRAGKTVAALNDMIIRAVNNPRRDPPPRYAYVAPTQAQAKDIVWGYLKHYTHPIPMCVPAEVPLQVTLPTGAIIKLYGAENYDRMRGMYLDGVTVDEPADIDPRAWPEVIRPALSDYQGWATFLGTPKGRDHFADMYEAAAASPDEWYHLKLKASESGILPESELAAARKEMTEDQYDQEFECSFDAAIVGAYYAKLLTGERNVPGAAIMQVPYDPSARVFTGWDLGHTDATAIFFAQQIGREIRIIDYYENSGEDLAHYVKVLGRKPYDYGAHILPHDGGFAMLGVGGKSPKQILEGLGCRPVKICPRHRVEDGINAVRMILPRTFFDAEKCSNALKLLRLYRAKYDGKTQSLRSGAVHDHTSHCADAFRYLAMMIDNVFRIEDLARGPIQRPTQALTDYDMFGSNW